MHRRRNQERAINLSIFTVSGRGEFSRVESDEAVDSTPGGHQQNETCTCFNREARRLQQNMTCTCHVGKNEQKRPVNMRRLLCPCGCLDLLPLNHDGLGHALSEVKHEDPVLMLFNRLDSVCTPSMYKPGSPSPSSSCSSSSSSAKS